MGLRNSPHGLLLCLIKSLCKCYCNCFFQLGSGLIRSIWSAQNWVRIRSLSPLAGIKSLKRMGFTLHISVLILKPIWCLIRAESYFFLLKHYQSTRCKLHHHFNIRLIWVGYPVEGGGVTNVFQFLWRHDIRKTSLFNICVADSSATWLLLTHFRSIFHFYTPENFWKLEVLWRFQRVSNGTLAWNGLMKHKWFDPIKIALATF